MNNSHISFEFFPPQTDEGVVKLAATRLQLATLKPEFFSVTFGAGGSTRDRTLETVTQIKSEGYEAAPHLSCVGSTRKNIRAILQTYQDAGIRRIVALRGDLPSAAWPLRANSSTPTNPNQPSTYRGKISSSGTRQQPATSMVSSQVIRPFQSRRLGNALRIIASPGCGEACQSSCKNGTMLLTLDDLGFTLWGWPNRFLGRMKDFNVRLIIAEDVVDGQIKGLTDVNQYGDIANSYNGYIWVDNIEELGPALRR